MKNYDINVPLNYDEITFLIVNLNNDKVLSNETGNNIYTRLKDVQLIYKKQQEIKELSSKIFEENKKESN